MGSKFTWIDDVPDKMINELLHVNAPVLLTGYIRPIISPNYLLQGFPTFYLPFIDFTNELEEKTLRHLSPRDFFTYKQKTRQEILPNGLTVYFCGIIIITN